MNTQHLLGCTADDLPDDVLVEILSCLDGDDLPICEAVSHRWCWIINNHVNWNKIFHRKLELCSQWSSVWSWKCRTSPITPETRSDYKKIYLMMEQNVQELNCCWRAGKCRERDIPFDEPNDLHFNDDFIINLDENSGDIIVLDKQTANILYRMPFYEVYDGPIANIQDDLLFSWISENKIDIHDARSGRWITELNVLGGFGEICVLKFGILAIELLDKNRSLQLWRRSGDSFEFICHHAFEHLSRVEIDDRYIAVYESISIANQIIYFISTKTFQIERSIGVSDKHIFWHYCQGILFHAHDLGIIRLLDVSSGKWLRTIVYESWRSNLNPKYLVPRHNYVVSLQVNSKYIAVMDNCWKHTTVHIFDLAAAKNPSTDPKGLALGTFKVPGLVFRSFKMNEREMYGMGFGVIYSVFKVFDFAAAMDKNKT